MFFLVRISKYILFPNISGQWQINKPQWKAWSTTCIGNSKTETKACNIESEQWRKGYENSTIRKGNEAGNWAKRSPHKNSGRNE